MPTQPQRHTPGPWKVSKHATPGYAPQFGIYSEKGPASDIAVTIHYDAEANARLIAASPELLAALEFLVNECDTCWGFDDAGEGPEHEALEQARAAIAAATEE